MILQSYYHNRHCLKRSNLLTLIRQNEVITLLTSLDKVKLPLKCFSKNFLSSVFRRMIRRLNRLQTSNLFWIRTVSAVKYSWSKKMSAKLSPCSPAISLKPTHLLSIDTTKIFLKQLTFRTLSKTVSPFFKLDSN